ncbi:TetR/AcrR family transcriptional regulator [Mycolicibacterium sp. P1-18]|uniref:TetR/AcrR family transcriptional regulator n=1 Tax=Mycolicibacterium sp. P1-18 TaxID=2024615 RepID=UPI0011F390DB|nr:TetR/AcrR family transcriptional regulator [Mycolicibacterium sp. P1-18]
MTTGSTGARGPYAKTAMVRQQIVAAATEVFSEFGYRATTMKEVAARAGISQRGLAHHFAGKAELLGAVIEARDEASSRLMAPYGEGLESILSMFAVVSDNIRRPGLVELYSVLTAEAASADHPAHDHYRKRYTGLRQYLSLAFESLREQGELNSAMGSDALAIGVIAVIDGLQLQWLYDKRTVDVEQTLHAFLTTIIPRLPALSDIRRNRRSSPTPPAV